MHSPSLSKRPFIDPPPNLEIDDDGVSRIFNPRNGGPLVITAPHACAGGLQELGVLDAQGKLIPGIDPHRVMDENLEPLVYAMARHGFPIIISKFTRLFFDAACLPSYAIEEKTRDSIEIPGFSGPWGGALMHKARQHYDAYTRALWSQIRQDEATQGRRHVLSLDTFTPQSLPGDLCDRRDMLVCIIANESNGDNAERLKEKLLHRMGPHLDGIRSRIRSGYAVDPDNSVIINRPYGRQVLERQLVLPEGGLTVDIRSDVLADDDNVNLFAAKLAEAFRDIFPERLKAPHVKPVRRTDSSSTPAPPWGPGVTFDI